MENPQNSLVALQSRFVWLVKLLERANIHVSCPMIQLMKLVFLSFHFKLQLLLGHTKIFKVAFWMRKHLSMTLKRTWVWSTSQRVAKLDLGALSPRERVTKVKTTIRKRNKDGEMKWQGSKDLKSTQYLDCV